MKNNRITYGMLIIIIIYGIFMSYYCFAGPDEPNDIKADQNIEDINTVPKEIGIEKYTQATVKTFDSVYLSEITSFYQCVITILFGVIGILLVVSFVYLHTTSKKQAEDMATDALETKSFQKSLSELIIKEFNNFQKENNLIDKVEEINFHNLKLKQIIGKLKNYDGRLLFLEKLITDKDYTTKSKEKLSDGNN